MSNTPTTGLELFTEVLESDKLNAFQTSQNYNYFGQAQIQMSDPSYVWSQLFTNPHFAMMVYEDMEEKVGSISSNLETRRNGVLSKPWHFKAASDSPQDKKIAEFVEETLTDYMNFHAFLAEALEAVGDGVRIGEYIYADAGDRICIEKVKFHPPQIFTFGEGEFAKYNNTQFYRQTGPLQLRQGVTLENVAENTVLPDWKFFTFSYNPKFGNRWGRPLKRKLYWASWMMRASTRQWLKYLEKGTASVVARHSGSATESEKQNALDAATAIVEESAVAMPDKFLIEVHEMVRNLGESHKQFVDGFCKSEMAQIILGQTLTSRGSDGGGGNRALGEVHMQTQDDRIETDSIAAMATVNQTNSIVHQIVRFNFGEKAKRPTFVIEYETKEDLNTTVDRLGKIRKDVELPISKKYAYEILQIPEPVDENDILGKTETPDEQKTEPDKAEFAEKKKLVQTSDHKLNSKRERFTKLRPSMIQFSDE
jgi:phage gp29-like protein